MVVANARHVVIFDILEHGVIGQITEMQVWDDKQNERQHRGKDSAHPKAVVWDGLVFDRRVKKVA